VAVVLTALGALLAGCGPAQIGASHTAAWPVSDNTTSYGGIYIKDGGSVTMTNSTVVSNTADVDGGIENGGILAVTNSTVSGNIATGTGGVTI
jgi:hypothetical protein